MSNTNNHQSHKMDNDSTSTKEVTLEFPGLIRVYKDGTVERIFGSPYVPPTPEDPETGVSSKDVSIPADTNLSARLYLPKLANDHLTNHRVPILVYFHGGAFCLGSAFSALEHGYMNVLASVARVLIVSVEYRLAPENPLPAAYQDCWEAINWTASLQDPWLANHVDLEAVFIGGDSAGGNIVHYIAMRAGSDSLNSDVKLLGAFLSYPYFLDDKSAPHLDKSYKFWEFAYPDAPDGPDSYMINPMRDGAPSLSGLGCSRVLVVVAEKDELRDTGVRYYEAITNSGFEGKVELLEVKEENHCFHCFILDTDNAKLVFQRLASFLHK